MLILDGIHIKEWNTWNTCLLYFPLTAEQNKFYLSNDLNKSKEEEYFVPLKFI